MLDEAITREKQVSFLYQDWGLDKELHPRLGRDGPEQRIKKVLALHGINTIDFPYFSSARGSAAGCQLNFPETVSAVCFF